jgi:pyrroline-5-carboxylate reductase
MKTVGFIGYGNMGRMLVNGFLGTGALAPRQVVLTNRTLTRLEHIEQKWPGITVAADCRTAAGAAGTVFSCVKFFAVLPILHGIKGAVSETTHLVTTDGCVPLHDVERHFPGAVSRVVPSLTSVVGEGIALVCHNAKVTADQAQGLERLLASIGRVVEVKESDLEAATNLTSCAPGMFAAIFDQFAQAGTRHSDLPLDVSREMVAATLFGTAKLLSEKNIAFPDMIRRVATKGGITEEGVNVLNSHLPGVFDEVFEKTFSKHRAVKKMITSTGKRLR